MQYIGELGPTTKVRCPNCKQTFRPPPPTEPKVNYGKFIGIGVAGLVVVGMIVLISWLVDTASKTIQRPRSQSVATSAQPTPPPASRWIRANYRALVDMTQLTQSGQTISAALAAGVKRSFQKGQLQPFLSPFSRLLPQALETAQGGPSEFPRTSILDELPDDSPQPAWVAILKGGSLVVTDDGNGVASVFAHGGDAKQAYDSCYSVLRHVLPALLPSSGQPLKVRTFAYQNDYATCELKLCLDPFEVEATAFPAPPAKAPLDLDSLSEFFDQGYELAGGSVDANNKLTLVGKKSGKQTLASAPVQLADLAVAYRAVFHAGDNQAFISLDPHRDPTRVTVSFGGFLEDTRIGSVVLEADKRFKTITSGLDPTSFDDLRSEIRAQVPAFATSGERDLALSGPVHSGWEGTRFWYYPDSVEIEASLDYRQGAIAKAQFTADAERSRDDFASTIEFDQAKKSRLSPAIQMNIQDLNENYSQYAAIFPELRELSVVARLMGLCIWFQKANLNQLDLDELLTVELPPVQTARDKKQLIAAAVISAEDKSTLRLSDVASRAVVRYLTPLLEKTVTQVFSSDDLLAQFLAYSAGEDETQASRYSFDAKVFRDLHGSDRISQVITNKQSLRAFASVAVTTIDIPQPPDTAALDETITTKKAEVERLRARLQSVKSAMDAGNAYVYNSYVNTYNSLLRQLRTAQNEANQYVYIYNSRSTYSQHVCEISGGIGLEPSKFKVRQTPESPLLDQTKRVAQMKEPSAVLEGEQWGRSTPARAPHPKKTLQLKRSWVQGEKRQTETATLSSASTGDAEHYWRSSAGSSGNWQDQTIRTRTATERAYDASSRTLQVADFEAGKLKTCVVGKYDGQGSIVFEKSPRQNISGPQQPPGWWR